MDRRGTPEPMKPFSENTCSICGGDLEQGYAVLLRDEQGNEARIDRDCCDAITALAKSANPDELRGALSYMKAKRDGAHPGVKRRIDGYIRKGEERLSQMGGARPVTQVRKTAPAEPNGFMQKFLTVCGNILTMIKVIAIAIFDVVKRFFTEDPKKIPIGNFKIGLRTLIASGATFLLLILIIILSVAGGGLTGKWKIDGLSVGGQSIGLGTFGYSVDASLTLHGNGKFESEGLDGLFDEDSAATWSVADGVLTVQYEDGDSDKVYYELDGGKLYIWDDYSYGMKLVFD